MKSKNAPKESVVLLDKPTSVLLIDNNTIDLLVNRKLLENNGISHVHCERSCSDALIYLQQTKSKYDLILVEIYLPVTNGFEFINKFRELGLDKKHGLICLLSASINPLDTEKAIVYNVGFIEKPLSISDLQNELLRNRTTLLT